MQKQGSLQQAGIFASLTEFHFENVSTESKRSWHESYFHLQNIYQLIVPRKCRENRKRTNSMLNMCQKVILNITTATNYIIGTRRFNHTQVNRWGLITFFHFMLDMWNTYWLQGSHFIACSVY